MNEAESGAIARVFYFVVALAIIAAVLYETTRGSPAVAAPIVTALGAVVAVLVRRWREQRQQIEQARRERVAVGYTTLVQAFFDLVESKGEGADEMGRAMRGRPSNSPLGTTAGD